MLDSMEAARKMGVCVVCGNALDSGTDSQICWVCKVKSDVKVLKKNIEELNTKVVKLHTELYEIKGVDKCGKKKEKTAKTVVSQEHGSQKNTD
jgi:hypothetical protein